MLKSQYNRSSDRQLQCCDVNLSENVIEKEKQYSAGTWFYPSGFDWMEEDLNVSLQSTERKGQGLYAN